MILTTLVKNHLIIKIVHKIAQKVRHWIALSVSVSQPSVLGTLTAIKSHIGIGTIVFAGSKTSVKILIVLFTLKGFVNA